MVLNEFIKFDDYKSLDLKKRDLFIISFLLMTAISVFEQLRLRYGFFLTFFHKQFISIFMRDMLFLNSIRSIVDRNF